MQTLNPFINEDIYKRDLNILDPALDDLAHVLSRSRNISIEEALAFVKKTISKEGKHPIKERNLNCLVRGSNGDRSKKSIPAGKFLKLVNDRNMPMAPSMVVYDNEKDNKSILSIATEKHVDIRAVAKSEMKLAKIRGDKLTASNKNDEQQNAKIFNNSLSGAQVSVSTSLNSPNAHSALTGFCRLESGIGNANNEKYIGGSRHYWSESIVLANFASICNATNRTKFGMVMAKYNLTYPTVENVMDMVVLNARYYWPAQDFQKVVRDYVEGMEPMERAMVMYVGDMYHLRLLNPDTLRNFIDRLSEPTDGTIDNPDEVFKGLSEGMRYLTNYVASDYVKGRDVFSLKEVAYDDYVKYCATADALTKTIIDYSDLIDGLWTTVNMPASVAEIPTMVRRVVPASDTDSTIFTVNGWVKWFCGEGPRTPKHDRVRDAVVYLASQSIVHYLAMACTNIGVPKDKIYMATMKNEFTFPAFMPTNATKHYTAWQAAQEGNLFKEWELELKGVGLKASTSPTHIVNKCHDLIKQCMTAATEGKALSFHDFMTTIADTEREVKEGVLRGDGGYLKRIEIKAPESYTLKEKAPAIKSHEIWNEAFGPKHGKMHTFPYPALRFNLDVANNTGMKRWLDSFEDTFARDKLIEILHRRDAKQIQTISVPLHIANEKGIPNDIKNCANVRRSIANIMNCYYIMLTGLRLYFLDAHNTNLVSDYY